MTAQEIFDRVWKTFIVDKAPQSIRCGIKTPNLCSYGHPDNGPGCAVACLIDDRKVRMKLYEWEMEANESDKLSSVGNAVSEGILPEDFAEHLALLEALQCWHDGDYSFGDPANLNFIAEEFGLIPGACMTTS